METIMTRQVKTLLPLGVPKAIYRPADLPEHAGNPLIEALPQFHQATELFEVFGRFPKISDDERNFSPSTRMLAVLRLNDYLEPLPSQFDVIDKIGLIVRAGYAHRNPLKKGYAKEIIKFYRESMEGKIQPIYMSKPSTAPSFALIGDSGVGKSTVIERALSFLPVTILHEKHHFIQVVWMKLECPQDGSLKQLLLDLLSKLDSLLGTSYCQSSGNARNITIDRLILDVAKYSVMHHLGVLVIDEIQNLLDANGIGQEKMLNFFVTFANELKVPVVVVGTPRALGMLNTTLRAARRIGDHGTYLWGRLPCDDEWSYFLGELEKYQWTLHPVQLTELSSVFYEQTQGIHALIVKLFQLSQLQAIRDGSERITEELIKDVANDKFKLVAPMLDALRNPKKNGKKLVDKIFQDLFIDGINKIGIDVEREVKLVTLKEQALIKKQMSFERVRAISTLMSIGIDQDIIQQAVTSLFDAQPTMTCNYAVKTILKSFNESLTGSQISTGNLMEIVKTAAASGISPDTALAEAGLVTPAKQES